MNSNTSFLLLGIIGAFAGLMSGFFGVGGGIVIVPALVFFAGFSQQTATGTSLAVLLPPVGLAATMEYYRKGHVDLRAAIIIASFLIIFSWISAHFANKTHEAYLKLAFGIFMIFMGLFIVANSLGRMIHK